MSARGRHAQLGWPQAATPPRVHRLWTGAHPVAVMGEFLTAAANTSAHTYAVAPFHSAVEVSVLRKLRELAGFPCQDPIASFLGASEAAQGPEHDKFAGLPLGDGITCPGGSYSNMLAMLAARTLAAPALAQVGWAGHFAGGGKPLVAFTSAQAHYSIVRAGSVLGLGREGVVRVPCDAGGSMLPSALDDAIAAAVAEGKQPFFVSATAGTTVLGAYDPLQAIADVVDAWNSKLARGQEAGAGGCVAEGPGQGQRAALWLHVDGSWGGSVITLPHKHPGRALVDGLERADSFVVNPHKLLGVPQQCSALLVKSPYILREACASKAEYLFHPHAQAQFDQGDKTLTCGRRPDASKLWLMWRHVTTAGLAARVSHALDMAASFAQLVARDDRFLLVKPCTSFNVAFWYLPKRGGVRAALAGLGSAAVSTAVADHGQVLADMVLQLYEAMQAAGSVLVNHNPLSDQGLPRFFRAVFNAPSVQTQHLKFILDEIPRLAVSAGLDDA